MRKGIDDLALLVVDFIKTMDHIVERAKKMAQLFMETLSEAPSAFSEKRCLRHPMQLSLWTAPYVKSACQKPFHEALVFFSAGSTLCMV